MDSRPYVKHLKGKFYSELFGLEGFVCRIQGRGGIFLWAPS